MFLLVISVNLTVHGKDHTNTIFKVSLSIQLARKSLQTAVNNVTSPVKVNSHVVSKVNSHVVSTFTAGVQLELNHYRYVCHLLSSVVFIQLTHSMLPLSLLILGCYSCCIYR